MQKTIRKISLIILLILVLPISAFFIYQFASLNESEKEINKIYIQQLETIIYSINQYSEDIVSSWMNKINTTISLNEKLNINDLQKLLSDNNSINSIFISDINFNSSSFFSYSSSNENKIKQDSIVNFLNTKKNLVAKLQSYLDANYRKIEPLGKITNEDLYLCIFPLRTKDGIKKIGGIFLNPNTFIQQNLAPKISQAGGDEFILAVTEENKKEIIYSNKLTEANEIILNKPLWLLPGLALGIKLESGNIEELVTGRYYENLLILGLLFLLLTAGIILIYFNLRKELRLTQLKSDFIANVSHELRTPLSLISMYSETLVLDRLKTEEKKKEYYSVINSETNRLTKIVNSILNFSKMETQTRKYEFQNINLVKLNEEIFKTYDFHIK
ncbi:MAG: hypothetical protein KDC67_05930, partial [Ignavibacteriae bacterium]|nr:hypothetical protein [Ignavibacteriota bacterium]